MEGGGASPKQQILPPAPTHQVSRITFVMLLLLIIVIVIVIVIATCSDSSGFEDYFCHVFRRRVFSRYNFQLSTTSTLRADDSVQVGKHKRGR